MPVRAGAGYHSEAFILSWWEWILQCISCFLKLFSSSFVFISIKCNCLYASYTNNAAAAKSRQLCPILCNPIDGSPPGSCVPGILQARTLEWVAISFSNAWKWKVKVKSCPTRSDPDCSLPGSSVHGSFQARVLEWVARAFSDTNNDSILNAGSFKREKNQLYFLL